MFYESFGIACYFFPIPRKCDLEGPVADTKKSWNAEERYRTVTIVTGWLTVSIKKLESWNGKGTTVRETSELLLRVEEVRLQGGTQEDAPREHCRFQ